SEVTYAYDEEGNRLMEPSYDGRPKPKVAQYHGWDAIGIEGAYVIEHQGTYFLFYSSWTRGYEIGYATAPAITGPWTKYEGNPFYGAQNQATCQKNSLPYTGNPDSPFQAVGHNEIFTGPDGRYWLSCHGILKGGNPLLVIDPIEIDEQGIIHSPGPTYTPQTLKW
ncbi:MAG: family 43 glycosylhydrolase, partial [Bacteroidota bacterium]